MAVTKALAVGQQMLAAAIGPGAKPREMTRDEALALTALALGDPKKFETEDLMKDPACPLGFKVGALRAKAFGVPVEARVLLLIAAICDRPGTVVLYVAALKAISANLAGGTVSWKDSSRLSPTAGRMNPTFTASGSVRS